jgi:Cu-Zn family superoxide dismutase
MNMRRAACCLAALLALGAAPPETTAVMKSATGGELGQVQLREGPAGVVVHLELHGLKPGWHAATAPILSSRVRERM